MDPAQHLRAIYLALPEAVEVPMRGRPTYRVRDRIFAMERSNDGGIALWCKAPPGSQEMLIGADPRRFFAPPYVGVKGWIGVRLDDADWEEVAALIERSHRLIAGKRRAASVIARATLSGRVRGAVRRSRG